MIKKIEEMVVGFILKWNKVIILVTILLTVFFGFFIFRLYFDNDMIRWVSKDSPMGKMPYYINDRFGSANPILALAQFDEVFRIENLNLLKEICDEIEKLPSVETVMSLANIEDVETTEQGIRVEKLIRYPLPDDPAEMKRLKEFVFSKKNYSGKLVSTDSRFALIMIKPRFGEDYKADKTAIEVKKTIQRIVGSREVSFYYSGNPFLMNSIAEIVMGDFQFLVPFVVLIVMLILFLSFKTIRGIVLPLLTVGISAVITMGLMGFLGVAMNVMSSAVPVILVAVGSAYGIHVLNNYYENSRKHNEKSSILRHSLKEIGIPVLMAGLTTFFGFISNVTAEVSIIKTFGLFIAIGVCVATLVALFFIPSVLINLKIQKSSTHTQEEGLETIKSGKIARFLSDIVVKKPIAVILGFCAVSIVFLVFVFSIKTKVDILSYFHYDSEPQVAARVVNTNFGGFNPFNVYIKADMENPDVLKLSLILGESIKAYEGIKAPTGIADILCELNYAMSGQNTIPETKAEVQNLWFFVEGKSAMTSMVTKEKNESLISGMTPNLNNVFINGLIDHINASIRFYGNELKMAQNAPDNPYTLDLERLFFRNYIADKKLYPSDRNTDTLLEEIVLFLSQELKGYNPPIHREKILRYCAGNESEIPMSLSTAHKIVVQLEKLIHYDSQSIEKSLQGIVPLPNDYTIDDLALLSESLSKLVIETTKTAKIQFLIDSLTNRYNEFASQNESQLNYLLSPFVWESVPVSARETQNIVRTTPIEQIEMTGVAYMIEEMRRTILVSQITSLLIALAAVLFLNSLTFKSFPEAMVSMVAIIFTIIVNFGIMGMLSISLDFVTAIIASILIGTGIDYTIHFISRYTTELKRFNEDAQKAYEQTVATSGKAIFFNAVSVGLGFAVMLFSNVMPLRTVGFLLALTMFVSSFGAITLLPSVIISTKVVKKHLEQVLKKDGK